MRAGMRRCGLRRTFRLEEQEEVVKMKERHLTVSLKILGLTMGHMSKHHARTYEKKPLNRTSHEVSGVRCIR